MTLTPSLLAFAVAAAGAALSIDAEQNPTGISSETSGNDTGLCNSTENAEQQQGFSPCGGAFWEVQAALGEAGAWASSTDIVDTLVDLCETEDKEACRTAVRDPSWLFACAREGLIEDAPQQSRGSDTRMRLAFLLLRHAADLAVRKTWEEKHFLEDPVPCRQPAFKSDAHRKFDAELQEVPVVPGRQCTDGACARDRCGLVVLDNVLLPEEVEALKSHAENVWVKKEKKAEEKKAQQAPSERKPENPERGGKQDMGLQDSAQFGDREGHVLFIYILERLRRLIARAARVPVSWIRSASSFLSRMPTILDRGADAEKHEGPIHCDESSFANFHYSAVLWLTAQNESVGGEVQFWDADQRRWRRTVQPESGRAAVFTSGWENIHRVMPLTQQAQHARWALPIFTSVRPPINATRMTKACVFPSGSKQFEYCESHLEDLFSMPETDLL